MAQRKQPAERRHLGHFCRQTGELAVHLPEMEPRVDRVVVVRVELIVALAARAVTAAAGVVVFMLLAVPEELMAVAAELVAVAE